MEPEATEPPYFRMRRHLGEPVAAPVWPHGVQLKAFSDTDAPKAHALLQLAYADGGGLVVAFEEWWPKLSRDDAYDPGLCFAVWGADGGIAGFAQCWTGDFVKDFVVNPSHRRRGLGRALLWHIFHTFQARGAQAVDLKVQADNPKALCFYESLGMVRVSDDP